MITKQLSCNVQAMQPCCLHDLNPDGQTALTGPRQGLQCSPYPADPLTQIFALLPLHPACFPPQYLPHCRCKLLAILRGGLQQLVHTTLKGDSLHINKDMDMKNYIFSTALRTVSELCA